jgi:thiol-disulfide isomerase/thioredoxin
VVDAESGAPVDDGLAVQIIYFRPDFLFVNRDDKVPIKDGKFTLQFDRTDIEHGVRIEANGYRTQLVGPWKIGDPNPQIDVKLERAPTVSGVVVDPEGRPVPSAKVFLGTHTQHIDIINHEDRSFSDTYSRETTADGTFTFPAQYEPYVLIAIHDAGYAEERRNADERPGSLKLERWAKVQGHVSDGGKPVTGTRVGLDPIRGRFFPEPRIDDTFWQTTDKEGRFVFERVPPVRCAVSARLSVWNEFPIRSSESMPLDLQAGEERTVELGGEGVTVAGRVKLAGATTREIDLNYSLNYLLRMAPGIEPPDTIARAKFDWREGWTDAFSSTEEGRLYLECLNHYFVKLGRDGTFRISGVRPGDYELALKVYETPEGCLVNPVGSKVVKFAVKPEDLLQTTVDLGDVEIAASLGPQVGDEVADVEFESLDGSRGRLSKLRGKYVLMDAWATWCSTCLVKLPFLNEMNKKYGADGRLAVVSLNLDTDKNVGRQFVREHKLDWTHGFLGDWSATDVPARLGISSVPVDFIVDPLGRLVWRCFSTEEIEKQLAAVMAK